MKDFILRIIVAVVFAMAGKIDVFLLSMIVTFIGMLILNNYYELKK